MYEESIRETAKAIDLRNVSILVTGATGLIGSCIIDTLLVANKEFGTGIKIYALSRSREKLEKRFGTAVIPIVQDIMNPLDKEIKYDYIKLLLKNLIIQIWRYKMFEEIRDIIAEQLSIDDLDELTLDTSLKDDLNADSLDAVEVIMALEDKYDIEIAEEDAENFKTIADIVNYIEENK